MEFSEKTVFILNHTNSFAELCQDVISLDAGNKPTLKTSFRKSFWSNAVDAVLQYCRVVFDLFSYTKPISVITFDTEEKIHSIWLDEDQNVETLWNIFSSEGPPSVSTVDQSCPTFMPGLDAACHMLQMLKRSQKDDKCIGANTGRVLLLTRSSEQFISSWIPMVLAAIEKPVENFGFQPITASEWIIIDLSDTCSTTIPEPKLLGSHPTDQGTHRFLYLELPANGIDLCRGLMRLVEGHFHLASTLVQDIPMKEEANVSSSSAMYGVELLHQAEAHDLLQLVGLSDRLAIRVETSSGKLDLPPLQQPNSGFSHTIGIKWVTPKSNESVPLRYSSAAFRVTLADVCNRASICLAQFVLGGRSIALAHRLPTSWPALSKDVNLPHLHNPNEALLLTCHGSVMYLHVLATVCPLAQPIPIPIPEYPSQEDLRVQAFIDQIVRPSRLAPASAHQNFTVTPRERAQLHLERSTMYWPLLESTTFLGVNKLADPLFEHLPKEFLEQNELLACKAAVDKLVGLIKQNVALTDTRKVPGKRSASSLPVAPSLQAEAVALALELDHMLSQYAEISSEHEEVRSHWKSATGLPAKLPCNLSQHPPRYDNMSSLGLCELTLLARMIATRSPQATATSLPDVFVKTIEKLDYLCDKLQQNKGMLIEPNYPLKSGLSTPKVDELPPSFEPINLNVFLNMLQPPKPRPTKREFTGVATADSKGMCQLYKSLREKEKTVT